MNNISTLTSAFRLKGYELIADDISVIDKNNKIKPGYPMQKLCEDAENVVIEQIEGKEKLDLLMCNIYRLEVVKMFEINNEYFMKCLSVVKNIPMYNIIIPIDTFSVS